VDGVTRIESFATDGLFDPARIAEVFRTTEDGVARTVGRDT
jgi:hypothetical protein